MTPTAQAVRAIRALANLIESYADLGPEDFLTPGIKGAHVFGGGNEIGTALLLAGGTAGEWYGPHVKQQREVSLSFQGVDFRGYQIRTQKPLCETCAAAEAASADEGRAS